jgi:zinc protease
LAAQGLTDQELVRAKKKLIGQMQIANQSNDSFGYMAALDKLYGLGFAHYKTIEREVERITPEEVKRVAAKYFKAQPYVLATVRPSS